MNLPHKLCADIAGGAGGGQGGVTLHLKKGENTLNGEQAQKVMQQLKPRLFVLPMHYGVPMYDQLLGPDEFLLGLKKDQVLRTPGTNELAVPVDAKTPPAPTVVLMGWKKAEPPKKK